MVWWFYTKIVRITDFLMFVAVGQNRISFTLQWVSAKDLLLDHEIQAKIP